MSSAEIRKDRTLCPRICRKKQPETKQNKTNTRKNVNVVHAKSPWSSSEDESGEEIEVMHIGDIEKDINKPFVLKGTFNRRPFHALIDTGY